MHLPCYNFATMLKYIYGIAGVTLTYLILFLLQVWDIVTLSADIWAKVTITALIIGVILLVLLGVRYFKQDSYTNSDGNSLIN